MMPERSATLYSVQIGRAIAALVVVISHAALGAHTLFPQMPDIYYHVLGLGNLGVDYFFVLSGFIIGHVTYDMQPTLANAKHYLRSRVIRIYVPYLPISLAMMLVLIIFPHISFVNREPFSLLGSLLLLPSNHKPVLWAAWTLQHEVVFYALFGLCFFWLKRPRLIYGWAVLIVALTLFYPPRWMHTAAGLLNLEFLLGLMACYLYHSQRLVAWRYGLVAIGCAVALYAAWRLLSAPPSFYNHVLAGCGFASIILGLAAMEAHVDFSRFRGLVFLGSASYAIYLVHGPVMSSISRVYTIVDWQSALPLLTLVSVLASIGYFLLIERPLTAWVKKRWAA